MSAFTNKNILIRADSSSQIGSGHVMRMLVLAQLLRDKGANITFASRICEGSLDELIKTKGFSVRVIAPSAPIAFDATNYASWLGGDASEDLHQSFGRDFYDAVIVDHYGAGWDWQCRASEFTRCLVVMDDEAVNKIHADIVINQNHYFEPDDLYKDLVTANTKCLIGPDYALLHPSFAEARRGATTRKAIEPLLVMMGGADPCNVSSRIAEALNAHWNVTFVVGSAYRNASMLRSICEKKDFKVLQNINNVAEIMVSSGFCIGAGGSASWERCCLKLPSALFSLAQNQREIIRNLNAAEVAIDLGSPENFDFDSINELLEIDSSRLSSMSEKASLLCDGQGAERVVQELSGYI